MSIEANDLTSSTPPPATSVLKPKVNLADLPSLATSTPRSVEPAQWPARQTAQLSSLPPHPNTAVGSPKTGSPKTGSPKTGNLKTGNLKTGDTANNTDETLVFTVPNSSRSAIIGTKGTTLRKIQSDFDVIIDLNSVDSDWSLGVTEVTIKGSRANVPKAKAAVLRFAAIPASISSIKRVPKFLFPFICLSERWEKKIIAERRLVDIKGSFDEVLNEMRHFDEDLADLESEMSSEIYQLPVDANGLVTKMILEPPADLLMERFGASVVPGDSESTYVIYARPLQIKQAVNAFDKHVSSQESVQVDINKCMGFFVSHARMLTRYFALTKDFQNLESKYRVKISGPTGSNAGGNGNNSAVIYEISGDKSALKAAKRAFVDLMESHSPSEHVVVRNMRFPLCRALAKREVDQMSPLLTAVWSATDELYLFRNVETSEGKTKAECQTELVKIVNALSFIEDLAANLTVKTVQVEDSQAAVNPRGAEATKLFDTVFVSIDSDGGNTGGKVDPEEKRAFITAVDNELVSVSGTKESVQKAIPELNQIVKLSKLYDVLSSHTVDIPFDAELIPNLIGRNRSQINKLRNDFDVKITTHNSGKVSVRGLDSNVRAAISAITEIQKKLRDTKVEELDIPPEYYPKLIGPGGRHMRRLQETYGCDIKVPNPNNDKNDVTAVTIRGPTKGVSAIKREFLELVNFEQTHSNVEVLEVVTEAVPRIVGKGGAVMGKIMHETRADIIVHNAPASDKTVKVEIKGSAQEVKAAVAQVKAIVDQVEHFTEDKFGVRPETIRALTTEKRCEIIEKAGGDPTTVFWAFSLVMRQNLVRLAGHEDLVAQIKKQVLELDEESAEKVKIVKTIDIPTIRIKYLIGSGGSRLQQLEREFNVSVDTDKRDGKKVQTIVKGPTEEVVGNAIEEIAKVSLPYIREVDILQDAMSTNAVRGLVNSGKVPYRLEVLKKGTPKTTYGVCCKNEEDCNKVVDALKPLIEATQVVDMTIDDKVVSKVIGPRGQTIRKIRQGTGCAFVTISESGSVSICGDDESVPKAKKLIQEAIDGK